MGYWYNICEMQQKQTDKGIKTYGQVLEQNTEMSTEERLVAIEEELIDALMYLEHLKTNLNMQNDRVKDFAKFLVKCAGEQGQIEASDIPDYLREWVVKHRE